ncbi:MAG: 3-hydroxyacyl-CoA dehydrogenase family protein [Bacteriovoracaceae bacterium]
MNLSHVTIIGAGTMGQSIAQWFVQQFVWVDLVDITQESADKACHKIVDSWEKLLEKGKFSGCQVGQFKQFLNAKTRNEINPETELVIEAIFEDLTLKKELFSFLDNKCLAKTIFSSNTSSFPIHLMAEAVSKERQKNFLGLHFFNPATLMKLVEVIKASSSEQKLCDDLYSWFEEKGKKPALCKDSPGFIVNRVARNFYGEALRIVEIEDEESMREVDTIMREVGGFKMGPFELMDLIGIDVNLAVTKSVWEAYDKTARFAPHALQEKMVKEGRFGKKTKRGFYRYE